ncbi:hypothetical protein [Silvimonas amylolytica]|uniref:Uncharacterized protein n=1 Tax=Silvimonas amylolytica TaxID=449663 RepID=A0ABQ2PJN2_9NEIS|nr:hypothetical protein [Silvimonas amylolytica]GGP25531.1 hypothetical protein GCM10010971_13500 [Silvimonas amylolytica]
MNMTVEVPTLSGTHASLPQDPEHFLQSNAKAVFVLLLAVWLCCHPWFGFWHDGMLYLGQALHRANPSHFAGDPFFMYGSQDNYTLFTGFYAQLIKVIGLASAGRYLMLLAHVAWFSAFYMFCRVATRSYLATMAACLTAVALPPFYGGIGIFSYAEPFLTARSAAEPLVLLALALLVQGRQLPALVALVAALPLHPLVAFSGLTVWFAHVVAFPQTRRIRWIVLALAVIGLAAALGLAFAHVKPFDSLLLTYNPTWWLFVSNFNGQVLISLWTQGDLVRLGSLMALYLASTRIVTDQGARRLLACLMGVTVLSLAVSLILGDWLHNIFILSIQIWRILSPVQALMPGLLVGLLISRREHIAGNLQAAIVLALLALLMQDHMYSVLLLISGTLLIFSKPLKIRPALQPYLAVGLCLAILLALLNEALKMSSFVLNHFYSTSYHLLYPHLVSVGIATLVVAVGLRLRSANSVIVMALVCLLCAVVTWDRRSDSETFFENTQGQNPFEKIVRPDESIYWNTFRPMPWMVFNRSSYVNGMQASAILFNENFAHEYAMRFNLVESKYLDKKCTPYLFGTGQCEDGPTNLTPDLCAFDDRLRWIVSEFKNPAVPVTATWNFTVENVPGHMYLYDCVALRKLSPEQQPQTGQEKK